MNSSTLGEHLKRTLTGSWYFLVPAVLSLFLGFRGLSAVGLWIDEMYTLEAVRQGLGQTNNEPPYLPYYSIIWFMTAGGSCLSETCLRYPSVLAIAAAVALISIIVRLLSNQKAGVAAGVLASLAPGMQRYAQDARPYAIPIMLVALSILLIVLLLQRHSKVLWVAYGFTTALAGAILPLTLAVLPGQLLLMARYGVLRQNLKSWSLSLLFLIPTLVFSLWTLVNFRVIKERGVGDIFTPHPYQLLEAFTSVTTGRVWDATFAGAFGMLILILAIQTRQSRLWLLALISSLMIVYLVSALVMNWWQGRSLLVLGTFIFVAAGLGLAERRWSFILLVLAIALIPSLQTYTENRLPWSRGWDYRSAILVLDREWREGDLLVIGEEQRPWVFRWALSHYGFQGREFSEDEVDPSRIWYTDPNESCMPLETWDLGFGNTLAVCKPLASE